MVELSLCGLFVEVWTIFKFWSNTFCTRQCENYNQMGTKYCESPNMYKFKLLSSSLTNQRKTLSQLRTVRVKINLALIAALLLFHPKSNRLCGCMEYWAKLENKQICFRTLIRHNILFNLFSNSKLYWEYKFRVGVFLCENKLALQMKLLLSSDGLQD